MEKIQGKVKKKKDLLKFLKVEKNGSCKFNWKLIAIFIFALLILGGGITFGVVKIVKHFHKGDEAVDLSHANWEERLNEDITAVFVCADPDGYKGSVVHLKGKIFNVTSDDPTVGLQWQMWCNPENSTNGVICYFENSTDDFSAKNDEYCEVYAVVEGNYEYENTLGQMTSMPLLSVIKANKTDRNSVEAPAEKVKKINQTQTKAGISVTLRKVELASGETRAFLAVKNRSGGQISFYSFNSVILQGSSQFKEETQYGLDDDLTIDSEIENGVTDKGAVYFKEIKSNKPFEIRFEFSDSNYNTQTFSFSVR